MSKIYVITAGDYSDYQIYGATTDPERAEAMRKIVDADLGRYGDAIIEEYGDGVFEDERLLTIIPTEYYRIVLRTGSDEASAYKYCGNANEPINVESWPWHGDWVRNKNGYPKREVGTVYRVSGIRADSEEKALKIAVDKVIKYRVEKGELGQ